MPRLPALRQKGGRLNQSIDVDALRNRSIMINDGSVDQTPEQRRSNNSLLTMSENQHTNNTGEHSTFGPTSNQTRLQNVEMSDVIQALR